MPKVYCSKKDCPLGGCEVHSINAPINCELRDLNGTKECAWVYSSDLDEEAEDLIRYWGM